MLIQVSKIPHDDDNNDNNDKNKDSKSQYDITKNPLTPDEVKQFISHSVPAGQLRKGGFVMLQGHPCKIVDISTPK